jgi:hypothetical protein
MKITIDIHDFRNAFANFDRSGCFSHCGYEALFNHLEEIDQNSASEMELDVIGLCCDFTEYASALKAAENYSSFEINNELTEKEQEGQALQFLADNTTVIPFDGGVIIQNF